MTDFTPLDTCLACGGQDLEKYLDLGSQPPANSFTSEKVEQAEYPLGLQVCRACFHSQNLGAVNPDLLYRNYAYASGTSETLKKYFREFVDRVEVEYGGRNMQFVLDIASNDGSLLREFAARGNAVFGVDPAANLNPKDLNTYSGFWDQDAVDHFSAAVNPVFDVIVAMNVLGHVADPLTFLKLAKQVLAPGGRIYIQTSQAKMISEAQFDTVYHEHLSFFTVRSFQALSARAGLEIVKLEHVPIHGTSYLVELTHPDPKGRYGMGDPALLLEEKSLGYYRLDLYRVFQERIGFVIDAAKSTIEVHRKRGYRIIGYGAAAKAMTFINASKIDLDFIVDDAPLKQGKYCPGSGIFVHPPTVIEGGTEKTLFVITAWNFADEIKARIKKLRPDAEDSFLVYFSTVGLV